ncbi:MAG TPA: PhzF family phenazine biosynthesis protein [Candidatus Dormibacteraeota bacterium]|nr:PhzF family phenazine biosynthesis protein [Candidatus Dormibacteraeota bacterium]
MCGTYEFIQLDVFTKTPLTGNPLAIFPDGRGLSDQQMQALAREMNLSETTFVLPREPQVEAQQGKRVRIFTVEEELPFAGHPTLGTALYVHSTAASGADEIVLDLNVGKIGVRFRSESNHRSNRVAGDVFGEMRQRDPEFGPTLPPDKVASVLGSEGSEIAAEWLSQIVSTGLPFAIVPIRDSKTLANLKPDLVKAGALLEGTGARFCYFISPEEREGRLEVRARMFFYGGEDPATGSAAGCAISWMVQHGVAKSDEQILIYQGVEARRPSEIFVRATRDGEKVTNVRVGGYAAEVLRGTVSL